MTNNSNLYDLPKENYKKVEEVREIEEVQLPGLSEITDKNGKVAVPEWLRKELHNPEAKFDVSCIVYTNIWDESGSAHTFDSGLKGLAVTTKGKGECGADGRLYASAGTDISAFRYNDDIGDLKLFSGQASAEAGVGKNGASAKYKLGVDVVNVKALGVRTNVGVDVGSEASIGQGSVKLKAAGLGFSFGREMGISTPAGGVSINLEEVSEKCTIQ